MRLIVALLAAVLLVAAAPAGAARTPRIVGGTDATQTYPAQAEIDVDIGLVTELCGGTLVGAQWVLTAGHCVSDEFTGAQLTPDVFTVRLGSSRLGEGGASAVDGVYRAPAYDNVTFSNDAALLHLPGAATQAALPVINDATVGAAAPGVLARVLGWGYTSEDGAVSDSLREVDVPIADDAACSAAYPDADSSVMVCAGEPGGGKDACQGDSGGPLMVRSGAGFVIAGIVSSGDGCGQPGKFGVYTRLQNADLRGWIASIVPEVAAGQQQAAELLNRKGELKLATCSRRSCSFEVAFAAGGAVEARLVVSGAVRRLIGVGARRIALASRSFGAAADETVRLNVSKAVRRGIKRAGKRSVKAKLFVSALTASGLRTDASRTVRLRR